MDFETKSPASFDPVALAQSFAPHGRLQIPDFLSEPHAAQALHALVTATPWARTFTVGGKSYDVLLEAQAETPADVLEAISVAIGEGGRTGFQYDFELWRISDEIEAGRRRGGALAPLEAIYDLLNGEAFLGLVRAFSGDPRPAYVDAQATRYRAGQFLTTHHDDTEGKHRLFAYVLSLTPEWKPDWGGLLLFQDEAGDIVEGFTPRFNVLNLFRVPQPHCVSQVAGFVTADRLSITGWIRSQAP